MDLTFPYTRYVCPCTDDTSTTPTPTSVAAKRTSQQAKAEEEAEDGTFNPHDPRSNYSLYPIEQLLYCDDCHHIRCPKCTTEEMMFWFCPNCLFEVPSSGVKSDGNRCTRHCYDCPLCSANLSITTINRQSDEQHLKPETISASQSYILLCQYCDWSSLDVDVSFSKPTKITEQLSTMWKARHMSTEDTDAGDQKSQAQVNLHHDTAFASLHKFYKEQLNESGDQPNPFSNSPYSSPAHLARIVSLYGGLSHASLKKAKEKAQPMREALDHTEGLVTYTIDEGVGDNEVLSKMKDLGLQGVASQQQRLSAPSNYNVRFLDDLWPVATQLLVRRGKRCKACRQFLARPEPKSDRFRYKIRILASDHVQRLTFRPLNAPVPAQSAAFRLRAELPESSPLKPHQVQQYILTVRNPTFEPVKVTLATPTVTPGKVKSRVTILCPSFTVGPSGDRYEEALSKSTTDDGSREAAMASLTEGDRQPEAGKIWSRHWNTTAVVLEVIPGSVSRTPSIVPSTEDAATPDLEQDDKILEVPIYVRVEWESQIQPHDTVSTTKTDSDRKEQRELAYWCVLGLGRIAGG